MNSIQTAVDYYRQLESEITETKDKIDNILDSIQQEIPFLLEGNCFHYGEPAQLSEYLIYKRINFVNVIKDHGIKTMIEIGFNAGHSATCFLAAMPADGSLLCFDLGEHRYMKPCFSMIQEKYPQLKEVILGDSKQTLKEFVENNPEKREFYDCIHVDGGHDETVFSDVLYSDFLLKPGGILILDDINYPPVSHTLDKCLEKGYQFVFQVPTYCFPHVILKKHANSDWE